MGLQYNSVTGELEEVADDEIDPSNYGYEYDSQPRLTDEEVEAELDRFREEYKDEIPNMEGFEKEIGLANAKTVTDLVKKYGKKVLDVFKDKNGNVDFGKLLTLAGGAYAASRPSGTTPTGYQGKIPKLTATSNMLTAPPVGRRPGSGGINYGGGVTYRDDKGNVVSSNEKTLEELRQAAINNPFNRGSTYEGGSGLGQTDLVTLLNALNPPTTPTTPIVGGGPVVGGGTVVGGGSTSPTGTKPAVDPTARYISINEFLRTNPSPEALAAAQKQYGVSNEELAAARKYGQERYNSINQFLGTNPSPEALAAAQKQYGVSNEELAAAKQYSQERYASIGKFLATNPSPEALAAAQKQYGVSDAELAAVRSGSKSGTATTQTGAPSASSDKSTSVPGQYGAIARPGYQQTPYTGAREGTKLPDGRILTAQGIYDPKTGDVLTPDGYRVNGSGGAVTANKDILSKEDAELMKGMTFSMDPNKDATPEEVKNYIQWQMTQPNPLGQGTLGDLYAKQGITDPYNSPIVQQQAQEQLKRQDRRDAMYAATQKGLDPTLAHSPQGYGMWEDPNWLAKQDAVNTATAQRNQQQTAAAPNVTVGGGIAGPAPAPQPVAPPPDVNDWAQTEQGQAAGGINSVYDSINTFLAGNPSQEALQTAMQDFGVNEATLEAAKSYAAAPEAPAPAAPAAAAPAAAPYAPTPEEIASWGYAKGGLARDGFVVPADVVSHFGNGSSEAGLKLLAQKIGATPIKGAGDGMSDSIKTKIDGVQEARVANDEAYVSPEMVAKLGNGSPEKGARKLYAMMDQIRKARTGTTKQGKQIDPNKYMPGGSVQRYQTGGTTTTPAKTTPTGATGYESSLSNWAGDYVTNMLGQGAALANKPYEAYTGPLTAGSSQLQNQAFNMAGNLQTPGSIGQAAGTAGGIANLAANMRYTPQTTDFLGGANMSGLGMSPSYGMGMPQQQPSPMGTYNNPIPMPRPGVATPYDQGPTTFSTRPMRVKQDPQQNNELEYIHGPGMMLDGRGTAPQDDGGMAHVQWEGPGNPRWEAEQRQMQNPGLLRTLPYEGDSGITRDPGYVPKDPNYGRGVDAEGREFFRLPDTSIDYGPDPLQKQRPTPSDGGMFQTRPMREYGGSQYNPATGAESRDLVRLQPGDPRLQGGMSTLPSNKLPPGFQQAPPTGGETPPPFGGSSEPFMQNGAMTGGVMSPPSQDAGLPGLMRGQQGMQAQQPQASQQVGNIAQQYMNPYLESALRPQMAEMQRAADIARMSDAARLTQAGAFGGSRQAIMESEGRRNLLGKQSDALAQGYSTAYDKAMAQFNADQARRAQEAQFGATFGLQGLQTGIQGAQTQGQLGAQQSQSDINNLRATLEAGGVQRGIESEGIAADKAQFEEARLNPYKMLQFQQSLLSGMPLNSQSYNMPAQSNLQQFAGGAQTLTQLLKSLGYKFD